MRKRNKKPLTDDDPMPWGEHKGAKLKDVPPEHLIHLFEQHWLRDWPHLHAYISERIRGFRKKVEDANPKPTFDRTPETYQDFMDNR